jgi:hypothetical protein
MTISTTLIRHLETKGIHVYPFDYYKYGNNQRPQQKEELEKALKSAKSVIVIVSNEAVKACQNPVISHVDDEYLMQIESVLRTVSKQGNSKSFTVFPVFVGQYFDINDHGHMLQKFRAFDSKLYAETIEISEPAKAAYYAREAAKKAKSLINPRHFVYDDKSVYDGEMREDNGKQGYGVYKAGELHCFVDDWCKWVANSVYEGKFVDTRLYLCICRSELFFLFYFIR